MCSGKEKNQTDGEDIADTRFYGPPTNCDELSKLGYTLNGYYWVNSSGQSNNSFMEVISCRFKKPKGSKEGKSYNKRRNQTRKSIINYFFSERRANWLCKLRRKQNNSRR